MSTRARLFAEMTSEEVADAIASDAGVILPVGAIEQHGPHLPTVTDAVLAEEFAAAVAGALGLVVAPTVSYGYRSRPRSGGGESFPGTLSLSARTLMAQVEDVVSQLLRHGFPSVILLNWHFENTNFLYEAAWLAHERSNRPEARILVYEEPGEEPSEAVMQALFPDGFPGWAVEHAAILETSLMLHLRPGLVRTERIVDDLAPRRPTYDIVPPPADLVAPSGTLWKATQATAQKGRIYWDEAVGRVTAEIAAELA